MEVIVKFVHWPWSERSTQHGKVERFKEVVPDGFHPIFPHLQLGMRLPVKAYEALDRPDEVEVVVRRTR